MRLYKSDVFAVVAFALEGSAALAQDARAVEVTPYVAPGSAGASPVGMMITFPVTSTLAVETRWPAIERIFRERRCGHGVCPELCSHARTQSRPSAGTRSAVRRRLGVQVQKTARRRDCDSEINLGVTTRLLATHLR